MSTALDLLAAGALPALEQVERDGWLLRCAPGSFKRSNSALALSASPGPLAVVEQFYAARGTGQVVAVGRGAVAEGWLGVFGMAVREEHRRQGHGREVLRALGSWARTCGADRTYLQVVAGNTAAQLLYAQEGLTPTQRYWYRTRR